MRLLIAGCVPDYRFHKMRLVGQQIAAKNEEEIELTIDELLPIDYTEYLTSAKRDLGGAAYAHSRGAPLATLDGVYLGELPEFEAWAKDTYGVRDPRPHALHAALARAAFRKYLAKSGHSHVYIEFALTDNPSAAWTAASDAIGGGEGSSSGSENGDGGEDNGRVNVNVGKDGKTYRLVFELYDAVAPKSAANFRALACGDIEGMSYVGSLIHRIVPGGWIQGGDISDGSPGDGGVCVFGGETFEDETFAVSHDRVGILGYANAGPSSNGSQFYLTLAPLPALDEQHVAFGRVVDGVEALDTLVALSTINQRPTHDVVVVAAGEFVVR